MPRPSPSTFSPAVLVGILAGSAIAVSGLVAAGVIVFVFRGGRPVAPPAAQPAETAAVQIQLQSALETPGPNTPDSQQPAAPEPARPPTVPPRPPPLPPHPEIPTAVAAIDPGGSIDAPAEPAATSAARDAESPAAAERRVDPEPPPQRADPAAAAAVALVASLPQAIDIIPAAVALAAAGESFVDLGPCCPEAAALLEMAIAQPAVQGSDEAGRLRVTPADPAADGWRIDQLEPGLDKEVQRGIARLAVRDDRLTAAASTSLPPGTARMLARSVLLVRVRGAGDWKPVRLVRPGPVGSVRFPALGEERGRIPLPLPVPFAGQGLPAGSRLEVESERAALSLEPSRDRPDQAFGAEIAWDELTDGTKIVVRLRIETRPGAERQATLFAEPGISGLEGKRGNERQRMAKLMQLGRTHQKVLAETFAAWDQVMEGMIRKPVNGLRDGEVEALLQSPLPLSPRLPPIPVSLQPLAKEFDEFLIRNARRDGFRDSSDLPVSLADWEGDWKQMLRSTSSYSPAYVQNEWSDNFQQPLRAWWADYRPRAVEQATEAAAAVAEIAAATVQIDVQGLAVDAIGPDGERYVVPLLDRAADRAGPANRPGRADSGRPTGID
jgi:hypothetical protein